MNDMATMYETFCKLNDPRVVGRSAHKLTDILILSVLAVICGARRQGEHRDHRRDGDAEGHSGEDCGGRRGLHTGRQGQPAKPAG